MDECSAMASDMLKDPLLGLNAIQYINFSGQPFATRLLYSTPDIETNLRSFIQYLPMISNFFSVL